MYLIAFAFGTMFGISLRIKSDFKDAYTMGYQDGIQHCLDVMNALGGDEDE